MDSKESVDEAFRLNLGSTGFFTPEMAGIRRRKPVIMGEFGEGGMVAPTKGNGMTMLEAIKEVFGG